MMLPIAISIISIGQAQERLEIKIPGQLQTFWMRKIPSGSVGEGTHKQLLKEFWISETEVTWDIYDIYAFRLDLTPTEQASGVDAEARPSKPYGAPDRGFGHQGYPALGMTANAAEKFCEWLSKRTGKKFRIPTVSEWDFAARAGDTKNPTDIKSIAWCWENSDDSTQPVGKKKANAWGLFDMLGNTQEWAIDSEAKPVTCGGSYKDKAAVIGFGSREAYQPKWQEADAHVPKSKWWLSDGPFVGMRVICEP